MKANLKVLGCLFLGWISPLHGAESLIERVEKVAAATKSLEPSRLLYETVDDAILSLIPPAPSSVPAPERPSLKDIVIGSPYMALFSQQANLRGQRQAFEAVRDLAAQPDVALKCVKHLDPKVRTLGMLGLFETLQLKYIPAIATLLGDENETFLAEIHQQFDLFEVREEPGKVGNIAAKLLGPYFHYNNSPVWPGDPEIAKKAEIISRHSETGFFGWWYLKWQRATGGSRPIDQSRYPKIGAFRKELDVMTSPEREIIQLHLWAEYNRDKEKWYSEAEMVEIARRLGHTRILDLLDDKPVTVNLDFEGSPTKFYVNYFLLEHATELLKAEDTEFLLRKKADTPMWTIAASRLAPERAVALLKAAILQHSGFEDCAFELWRIKGAAELPYLVDWFYSIKDLNELNQASTADFFLSKIEGAGNSARPLLKALITDPRLGDIGFYSLRELVKVTNKLAARPVIKDTREIGPAWGKGGEWYENAAEFELKKPQEYARMVEGMKAWRTQLLAAAKEW